VASPRIRPGWDLGPGAYIVIAFGVLGLTLFIASQLNSPASRRAGGSPPENPTDIFEGLTPKREISRGSGTCGTGIPAGVQVVSVNALAGIVGSDGKASYDADDHFDAYANGVGQWYFSFKVLNNTLGRRDEDFKRWGLEDYAVGHPDFQCCGYCLTALQYEVEIESDDERLWKGTGKETFDRPLDPGWEKELARLKLSFGGRPKNGNLTSWRITKAWGFFDFWSAGRPVPFLNPKTRTCQRLRSRLPNRVKGSRVSNIK